jgi:hypothetical protein
MPLEPWIIEKILEREREERRRREQPDQQPQLPIPEPPRPPPPAPNEENPDDGNRRGVEYIDPDDNPYNVPLDRKDASWYFDGESDASW